MKKQSGAKSIRLPKRTRRTNSVRHVRRNPLKEVEASSVEAARKKCPPQFDAPTYAPAVAIHWPESDQSHDEKEWLKKHVGRGL